ncbi:MAG: methionyl-tRNA formyltransferase [Pseudomonadota bacterium]
MRIAFAGTPEFAADALRALIAAGHEIALVLTQPDRPSGRGMKLMPSAVKQVAIDHSITVHQPISLKTPESNAPLITAGVDVMVVAAYGLILPSAVLAIPKFGCLNIHASLLPRWRGAAPIQRAILAGDSATGICIMQMDAGLDTGPILLSSAIPITEDGTGGTLHDELKQLGATLINEALAKLSKGELSAKEQPTEGVTYAEKLKKEEAGIDWSQSAIAIERKVRAFNPFPITNTRFNGELLRVWRAHVVKDELTTQPAGQIIRADAKGIVVACGDGALALTEIQKAGGKPLNAAAFLAGTKLTIGSIFGNA